MKEETTPFRDLGCLLLILLSSSFFVEVPFEPSHCKLVLTRIVRDITNKSELGSIVGA